MARTKKTLRVKNARGKKISVCLGREVIWTGVLIELDRAEIMAREAAR